MAAVDVEKLVQEISADGPCGEDLEYDPSFQELERIAQPKPEQQLGDNVIEAEEPSWREVEKLSTDLFSKTKDLRVATYLTSGLLRTKGIIGFSAGLKVISGLLGSYWDEVHPLLDPDDGNDPTIRINTVSNLNDPVQVLNGLKETAIVNAKGIGSYSLKNYDVATGLINMPAGSDEEVFDTAVIDAAFMETDLDELQSTFQAVVDSASSVSNIEKVFTDKIGAANAPDFAELNKVLSRIQEVIKEQLSKRGIGNEEDDEQSAGNGDGGKMAAANISGDVRTREDVIRMLDKICDYYNRQEPSSPLPILLQRAKRLVRKDFMEIIKDLAPDGVKQAELMKGKEEA